ncbi:hypothetical protein AB0C96_26870 [Streptomyces sp. NPDC048506]|uniref:hypothetical protein n=1 Tax=Streptomyces sp. NPDC048506 TaxID=3155028 RepID=UPI0034464E50
MKIKKIVVAAGVATAGVAFAVSTQGSAQAVSAEPILPMDAPSRAQAAWTPPAGYSLERSFGSDDAACRKEGDRGVARGKWRQYVCHGEMVQVADAWVLEQHLYVKK